MKFPIHGILNLLERQKDCVFLESARADAENFLSYIFMRPQRVVATHKIEEVKPCLRQLDQALKKGYYAAGFLAYEAGAAFEERLKTRQNYNFPLLWFGLYRQPLIYNHRKNEFERTSAHARGLIKEIIRQDEHRQKDYCLKNIRPNISPSSYIKGIKKIKHLIARGYTYQVNYTFKLKFTFSGSCAAVYHNLRNKQAVPYSALLKTGCNSILSFSPELFFRKTKNTILTRPMKGTATRGKNIAEDAQNIDRLKNCRKNRSENVMIVDLLRNDLGRISATGSVRAGRLFHVEKYQTLLQMTSDISSRLKPEYPGFDIFSHIFPSGSVTGAPKIKTMEIISKLEKEPRRVYTGSIGFFSPQKQAAFNVAIRTLLIDQKNKSGEMGVGSGIVYDSDPQAEYAECCLKANFLTEKLADFELIETVLWHPARGYLFLKGHLERLQDSARYFDFSCQQKEILPALMKLEKSFSRQLYKVRLLLAKTGKVRLQSMPIKKAVDENLRICLSGARTDSKNIFLYHKTTRRKIYDAEFIKCQRRGFYDVIFSNEKDEITEGAISNIFIRKNGTFFTPPVSCGLLGGVYRKYLLNSGKYPVREKVLFKQDLKKADRIYMSNSVRGLVRVHLERKNH